MVVDRRVNRWTGELESGFFGVKGLLGILINVGEAVGAMIDVADLVGVGEADFHGFMGRGMNSCVRVTEALRWTVSGIH